MAKTHDDDLLIKISADLGLMWVLLIKIGVISEMKWDSRVLIPQTNDLMNVC